MTGHGGPSFTASQIFDLGGLPGPPPLEFCTYQGPGCQKFSGASGLLAAGIGAYCTTATGIAIGRLGPRSRREGDLAGM